MQQLARRADARNPSFALFEIGYSAGPNAPLTSQQRSLVAATAARHAEIARRYKWGAKQAAEGRPLLTMGALRSSELERIFRERFHGRIPDSLEGRKALQVMAEQILLLNRTHIAVGWVKSRAPWLDDDEVKDLVAKAAGSARRLSADVLGWRIELTIAERTRLKIKTIGAIGFTAAQRQGLRKERAKVRKQAERRAMGSRKRSEYEANSASRTRPWEAFGWSRATWYRRGKPDLPPRETGPGTIVVSKNDPIEAALVSRPVQGRGAQERAQVCELRSHARSTGGARFGKKLPTKGEGTADIPRPSPAWVVAATQISGLGAAGGVR